MFAAALTGCQPDIPADDYFPLQEGLRWRYQVEEHLATGVTTRRFSIENLGRATLGGKYETEDVRLRRTSDGTDYYIVRDDDGVWRVAKRAVVELEPQPDKPERKILPPGPGFTVGDNWNVDGMSYALRKSASEAVPNPEDVRFNMEFEVVAVNDRVKVPAGVFENCVRVEGRAVFSLYVDPRLGYMDIPVTQTEWYAPGVGLVKLVREETLDQGFFTGGTISFELLELDY
jgi:hypothetical protein